MILLLTLCVLFLRLDGLSGTNSTHSPRMIFTDKETTVKRSSIPEQHRPVQILLEGQPDTVTAVGHTYLDSYDFQNPKKAPVERKVLWEDCPGNDCNYKITVVHQRKDARQVFVCGTDGSKTLCCDMNSLEPSPTCIPSEKMRSISETIMEFTIRDGEQFALVESEQSADLYITYSGAQDYVGIYKFGEKRVRPANNNKGLEQYYVGLMLSGGRDAPLQDRVYAFYRQKNRDKGLYSEMWLPFVTQVCMADVGGPKNNLQFSWTSQMHARLFCGDPDSKQHFSELVDTAIVHADRWQDSKVYALFRNEWGMSAVCVYKVQDIDNVFTTSLFKGFTPDNQIVRPRECVQDSTKISSDILRNIEKTSEMKEWVQPEGASGPILFNHHNYTHIHIDRSQHMRNNTVLFLSLNNGGVHKVMQNKNQAFIIAEYRPFNHRAHIQGIILHPSSRKLYVYSTNELVQLDVANCGRYGNTCQECVLSRDPYCGWNGTHCTPQTTGTLQDAEGNHAKCPSQLQRHVPEKVSRYSSNVQDRHKQVTSITLRPQSKYFLQCPVSSRHAQYSWRSLQSSTSCSSREEQCLLLINSMGPEQVGTYECVSEEMGYSKVLAQYQLQLESRAVGQLSSPVVWICVMVVLIKNLPW
ncbi:semaphorin-7A [Stegastes partitus]|uniref:Semaphorin-7A-like n=1 Tax=Stegastes partitus TaxID=144197 RepID=A0A3B5B9V0_9TELE|nr:PREDICTED: semaphorin-7A-like [Stegastes partitus]